MIFLICYMGGLEKKTGILALRWCFSALLSQSVRLCRFVVIWSYNLKAWLRLSYRLALRYDVVTVLSLSRRVHIVHQCSLNWGVLLSFPPFRVLHDLVDLNEVKRAHLVADWGWCFFDRFLFWLFTNLLSLILLRLLFLGWLLQFFGWYTWEIEFGLCETGILDQLSFLASFLQSLSSNLALLGVLC